ncbi:hypothetical protein Q4I30_007745 [Leishmania utingensis]|uniref:Uncharacterized protein n=1 Tax=Leishmania utingensis TaxID=653362 RepID=A0AAW2ZZ37_9TRYP
MRPAAKRVTISTGSPQRYSEEHCGPLDPSFAALAGVPLTSGSKYEADDMKKRVCRSAHSWCLGPWATQAERYNFFKALDLPEERLLPVPYVIPSLSCAHAPRGGGESAETAASLPFFFALMELR